MKRFSNSHTKRFYRSLACKYLKIMLKWRFAYHTKIYLNASIVLIKCHIVVKNVGQLNINAIPPRLTGLWS